MKHLIILLLFLPTFQVLAQEWSIFQYQDRYSIAIPPTMELRKESDIYTQVAKPALDAQRGIKYNNIKGLTAQDRAQWEKDYASKTQGFTPDQVERTYRNVKFKEMFGNREDYASLKALSPEQRDSLYNQEYEKEHSVRVIFQQVGLSTNKHEFKTKYCRILIDYHTCGDEYVPCSGDKLELDEEYFANEVVAIQKDCESTKTPLIDIISNDTLTIANSPATKIIYRRQGINGASPVIVAIYTIFNYSDYVRLTMSFREEEQDIWMKDLVKARESFRWVNQYYSKSNTGYTSKDEAIKMGLELGVLTVCKIILEVLFGCFFLGFIIRIKNSDKLITSISSIKSNELKSFNKDKGQEIWSKKKLWNNCGKLLLSIGIAVGSITICVSMGDWGYYINCFFYVPFYFIIGIYYFYLIWRKRDVQSEDIVLYPLLKKIGIYSNISDPYLLRRSLLQSIIPLLLATILLSLLVVSIGSLSPEDTGEVSAGSFILCLPVIAWIVFFISVYGKKWLDNASNMYNNKNNVR